MVLYLPYFIALISIYPAILLSSLLSRHIYMCSLCLLFPVIFHNSCAHYANMLLIVIECMLDLLVFNIHFFSVTWHLIMMYSCISLPFVKVWWRSYFIDWLLFWRLVSRIHSFKHVSHLHHQRHEQQTAVFTLQTKGVLVAVLSVTFLCQKNREIITTFMSLLHVWNLFLWMPSFWKLKRNINLLRILYTVCLSHSPHYSNSTPIQPFL